MDRADACAHCDLAAGDVPLDPARQAASAIRLEYPHHAGTAGAAAVHPDGRTVVPHQAVAIAVSGAGAMGRAAAGTSAACQRDRLHDLRGDLRFVGGDDAGDWPHVAQRTAAPGLFQGYRDRLARRRRHARLSDTAVEHHDHLWRARRRLDPEAVHRRSPAGPAAGGDVHGLGDAAHHAEPDAGAGGRSEARAGPLGRTLRRAEGPCAGSVSDRVRARLDVWRPCDAVGGGSGRRARRSAGRLGARDRCRSR